MCLKHHRWKIKLFSFSLQQLISIAVVSHPQLNTDATFPCIAIWVVWERKTIVDIKCSRVSVERKIDCSSPLSDYVSIRNGAGVFRMRVTSIEYISIACVWRVAELNIYDRTQVIQCSRRWIDRQTFTNFISFVNKIFSRTERWLQPVLKQHWVSAFPQ